MYQKYLLPREIEAQNLKRHQFLQNRHFYFFPAKPIILLTKYERWKRMAKLMGLSRKACLRLEWIVYYCAESSNNVSLTCRHFGIKRQSFYYWFNRFQEDNLRTLEDMNRAPKRVRQREITSLQEQSRKWGQVYFLFSSRKWGQVYFLFSGKLKKLYQK